MRKYEYVDPALHTHCYQKHFYHTQEVDRLYRMKHYWGTHPEAAYPTGTYPGGAYPTGTYSDPMGSGWEGSGYTS